LLPAAPTGKFLKRRSPRAAREVAVNKHMSALLLLDRPSVFRHPGSLLYADNCRDLQAAARSGEVDLHAWTRGSYPGAPLGDRLPGICTVGYWDARHDQDWGLARHCNEGFKIAYLGRGRLDLIVDDVSYPFEQGQFIIIRPWQLHSIGNPKVGPSRLLWIILDGGLRRPSEPWRWPVWMVLSPSEAEMLGRLLTQNDQPVWDGGADLCRAFEAVPPILLGQEPQNGETRLKLAINSIMLSLLERLVAQEPKLDPSLSSSQRTVSIFLRRLAYALNQAWTLDAMADECGLSRTRFADHCKRLTNMSPMQFLQNLRLEQARRKLLEEDATSVTEVAFACGFNSSQYFSSAFRKRYGFPPMEVRVRRKAASIPEVGPVLRTRG
jgi:AraC family L-rhamnose operon regulatory protein RhaS